MTTLSLEKTMLKSIQLKLSKIKYSGDSIGDDIRVEIEVLGKFLRVDKRIKAGTAAVINQKVGRLETDRGIFYADASIAVIEKDLLFNDVGNTKGAIKINTGAGKPQQFIFKVQVRETRSILGKFWGKATAVFEITLEAEASDAIRIETTRWMEIYNVLIKARKNDFMSVGALEVVD